MPRHVLAWVLAALVVCAAMPTAQGPTAVTTTQGALRVFTSPDRSRVLATAFPAIDTLFAEFATQTHVPGVVYGIVIDGQLAHVGTFGVQDVETGAPVTVDSVFRIASMTKSFTALAILSLRDAGRLSLDDPAERYVPELKRLVYPTTDAPRITLRHLLSHAAGFPEDNPWGDRQLAVSNEQMGRMLSSGIPFSTSPGTSYEYSNYGFAILGRVVANVSGESYASYVGRTILAPLGLTATTLEPTRVEPTRVARGYRRDGERWIPEPSLPDGAFGAMGGMLTSARDLARYVAFLMSAWPPRNDPDPGPVARASLREMQQVWRTSAATVDHDGPGGRLQLNAPGYGYGLRVWQTCDVGHVVAHSGGLPGFGSHMRWLPDYGVGIVAMGNRTYTSWGRVMDAAFDRLAATGALEARAVVASPALKDAHDRLSQLFVRWNDGVLERLAADNLFLDTPLADRRAEIADLIRKHGVCRPLPERFVAENALRGSWILGCDRGWIRVAATLSPTTPPLVQSWTSQSLDVLPPRLGRGVCRE